MQSPGFIRSFWAALPIKLCLVGIIVLWSLKESYPFSHFPMYSNFSSFDYVVFITDQDGQPLPLNTVTAGIRTARLKKKFNGELNEVRKELSKKGGGEPEKKSLTAAQMAPAGEEALKWIVQRVGETGNLPAGVKSIQLRYIGISYEEGEVRKTDPYLLAELPAPQRNP